jgi:hypothetical protein
LSNGDRLHLLTDVQYDVLKFVTRVVLPATGTLYFALASIWGLPASQEVLGSIIAFQAFLGALLGISNKSYEQSGAKYGGEINVIDTPDKTIYSLDLNHDPEELKEKKEVTFKVNQPPLMPGPSQ